MKRKSMAVLLSAALYWQQCLQDAAVERAKRQRHKPVPSQQKEKAEQTKAETESAAAGQTTGENEFPQGNYKIGYTCPTLNNPFLWE